MLGHFLVHLGWSDISQQHQMFNYVKRDVDEGQRVQRFLPMAPDGLEHADAAQISQRPLLLPGLPETGLIQRATSLSEGLNVFKPSGSDSLSR